MTSFKFNAIPSLKFKLYFIINKDREILYVEKIEFIHIVAESFRKYYKVLITEDEAYNQNA